MKNIYAPLEVVIICLDCDDCIRTSTSDYNDNELPLVPFEP